MSALINVQPIVAASMTEPAYREAPGLSNSSLKDLEISPLRFWHLHINPNRPVDEPTPAQEIGTALHCKVLEPKLFDSRFACALESEDHWLVTVDDIRTWLKNHNVTPKGTLKDALITQALACDPNVKIADVETRMHAASNQDKKIFHADDWKRIHGMADALLREPQVVDILASGKPEVSMFGVHPETGVLCKCRLDWDGKKILDLKTFTQMRGKSIDKSVADAIYYERYYRQAYFYSLVDSIQDNAPTKRRDFVMAFVESEEPHEVRLKVLRSTTVGQPNLYWMKAANDVTRLIRVYADYFQKYGIDPWRDPQDIDPLIDEEMPQMAWV